MSDWNAALYRQFEAERTRPAADLLAQAAARLPAGAVPSRITDLGCGPGNSTELLARAWPGAAVTGVDLSPDMLAAARDRLPACRFEAGDIASWTPGAPPDLIFANASLQWVGDHASLLPRLLECLAPGGVLAVQMPDNLDEPSHSAMREVAAEAPFALHLGATGGGRARILDAPGYYDLLAPRCAALDVWRTAYAHPMASPEAIVAWLRATGLRPFLDALPEALHADFLARYEARLDAAYPARADGRRLLAFPRLFVVAHRQG